MDKKHVYIIAVDAETGKKRAARTTRTEAKRMGVKFYNDLEDIKDALLFELIKDQNG